MCPLQQAKHPAPVHLLAAFLCLRPDAEGADAEGDVSMVSVAPKATFKALRKPVRG